MKELSNVKSFQGAQVRYEHFSRTLNCRMTFSVFFPKLLITDNSNFPVVYWLSGLTCTDENFVQKAGIQRHASELGIIIVAPDTSPRGENIPDDENGAYDFGLGAGFYLNATREPWKQNYRMYDYVVDELPSILQTVLKINSNRQSIMGHSMGGHGAITIALKNQKKYRSVSAFAPIASPMNCPWGIKAFRNYLGREINDWLEYDSSELIKTSQTSIPLKIDQGSADQFLKDQLKPELLLQAAEEKNFPVIYNLREGYDHSYFFISSFIENHLKFHAKYLM